MGQTNIMKKINKFKYKPSIATFLVLVHLIITDTGRSQ